MSAWPEALYIINTLKKEIKNISYPIVASLSDLENVEGTMRFATTILTSSEDSNNGGNE